MVRKGYQKVLQYIVMALVVFVVIIPLIWLVVLSFMDNKTIMNNQCLCACGSGWDLCEWKYGS